MKVGILGGGITGIAIQHFLRHPSEVLEAETTPGGLCRTFFKDGFGYDIGGHILFSKHEIINQLVEKLLGENINHCKRNNKIYYNGRFVKYPFENGIGALDKHEAYDCLIDYLKNDFAKPTNLKEWCYYTFGKSIAEKYLIPYNDKIWNLSSEQLSLEWVDRIPKPPVDDVVKSAMGIETEGYLHQLFFKYPKIGGMEALVRCLIKQESNVTCNFRVKSIRRMKHEWAVSDGQTTKHYDKIIVAFPIHEAIHCFENIPSTVKSAVENLRYNTINIAMLGVNNESLLDKSAIYIPDRDVVTHRICYMGYFSKQLIKPGTSSLIAEITTNPGDTIHELSNASMIEKVANDLDRINLIQKQDIIVSDITRMKYGYPVYDLNYTKNTKIFKEYFSSIDVTLCGRFAEFDYINSDECLRRAMVLSTHWNESLQT